MQLTPFLISFGICLLVAIPGNAFIKDDHKKWFLDLQKPSFFIPMSIFYIVGALYYLIMMAVLYRLLIQQNNMVVLGLSILLLVLNEVWNYFFFGLKSTRNAFWGMVIFFIFALILQYELFLFDKIAAFIFLPYLGWVVYDLYWTYGLMKLNRD